MYCELKDADLLFFSPAQNQLPRHERIRFWPVRFIKQVAVSIWLHCNARRIIAEHRLDRLNVHTGPGGVLLVRRLPVPVVVTCHHTYRQQCRHIASQFWKRIFIPFEARTYRLADSIVCVSDATKDALTEQYGVPKEKITTVYNAVDTVRFRPTGAPKSPHTVVYVGRLDRRKGIEFLIRSLPLVRERIPDVRLLVGGKGAYLEKMKDLVRRLGIADRVEFLGFVPEDRLNELYNQGECVVVPSMFEGFGITVIEALAAGTRVVGSDVDGIREILAGGKYGRLAPYGDFRALAEAIVAELSRPQEAPALPGKYRMEAFCGGYLAALGLKAGTVTG